MEVQHLDVFFLMSKTKMTQNKPIESIIVQVWCFPASYGAQWKGQEVNKLRTQKIALIGTQNGEKHNDKQNDWKQWLRNTTKFVTTSPLLQIQNRNKRGREVLAHGMLWAWIKKRAFRVKSECNTNTYWTYKCSYVVMLRIWDFIN